MAISRNIRSIWVTDYDKSIGDVASYLDSGSGFSPALPTVPTYRSTITGVREIRVDSYFWGESKGGISSALLLLPNGLLREEGTFRQSLPHYEG